MHVFFSRFQPFGSHLNLCWQYHHPLVPLIQRPLSWAPLPWPVKAKVEMWISRKLKARESGWHLGIQVSFEVCLLLRLYFVTYFSDVSFLFCVSKCIALSMCPVQAATMIDEKDRHISDLEDKVRTLEKRLQGTALTGDEHIQSLVEEVGHAYRFSWRPQSHFVLLKTVNCQRQHSVIVFCRCAYWMDATQQKMHLYASISLFESSA